VGIWPLAATPLDLTPAPACLVMKILDLAALTLMSALKLKAFVDFIPSALILMGLSHVLVILVTKVIGLDLVALTLTSALQMQLFVGIIAYAAITLKESTPVPVRLGSNFLLVVNPGVVT
jgi:hypothetical protein